MTRIFISHCHEDKALADAVKTLLKDMFGTAVDVRYSTDAPSGGGVQPGTDWYSWIKEQVTKTDTTVVLLTPRSVGSPWVMWETGAVSGVALATNSRSSVIPMFFHLKVGQLPDPLTIRHAICGEEKGDVNSFLQGINNLLESKVRDNLFNPAAEKYVPKYMRKIERALRNVKPLEQHQPLEPFREPKVYRGGTDIGDPTDWGAKLCEHYNTERDPTMSWITATKEIGGYTQWHRVKAPADPIAARYYVTAGIAKFEVYNAAAKSLRRWRLKAEESLLVPDSFWLRFDAIKDHGTLEMLVICVPRWRFSVFEHCNVKMEELPP